MSKGNLFLGQARGSVGDVTFSRLAGQQVARVRNRSPRNPRSVSQMVTRIIQSSVAKAYSFFKPIADHSFQGRAEGQQCQSVFMQLNAAMLRTKLVELLSNPTYDEARACLVANFSYKGDVLPVFNEWVMSSGSLPTVPLSFDSSSKTFRISVTVPENPLELTYQAVITALNAEPGDQLTLLGVSGDFGASYAASPQMMLFEYSRIILMPSDGALNTPFLTTNPGGQLVINKPNAKNEGTAVLGAGSSGLTIDQLGSLTSEKWGVVGGLNAAAAVLSRRSGTDWLRSGSSFVLSPDSGNWGYFADAFMSYVKEAQDVSPLYLNQANVETVAESENP